MAQNHLKFMALNMVHPINADRNKPKKIDVVNYMSKMFAREDPEFYSPAKVEAEIDRLIATGQMIIKPDGLAVLGTGIFEEGEAVSPEANSLSQTFFIHLKSRSEFSLTTHTMDGDVIEEMTNSMAVIIDKQFAKTNRKLSPTDISKAVLKELQNRRGFRQPIDMMSKNDIKNMISSFNQLVETHIFKNKLDKKLSLKKQINSPKI